MSVTPHKSKDGSDEGGILPEVVAVVADKPGSDEADAAPATAVAAAMPSLSEKARRRSMKARTPAKPAKLWTWDGTLVDSRGKEVVKVDNAAKRRRSVRKDRRVSKISKKNSRAKIQVAAKKSDEGEASKSDTSAALESKETGAKTAAVAAAAAVPVSSTLVTALVGMTDSLAQWFADKKINVITAVGDMLYDLGVEEAQDMDDLDKDDIEKLSSVLKPDDVKRFKEALKNQMLADMPITTASAKVNDGTDDGAIDGVDDLFGVFADPLSSEEISAVRDDLALQVKDHTRLKIFLSKFDADQSGAISKKELKALVETVADGDKRILGEQGIDQIWEAAWKGNPHDPRDELSTLAFEDWLFASGNAAPQKIDDDDEDDEANIDDLFD